MVETVDPYLAAMAIIVRQDAVFQDTLRDAIREGGSLVLSYEGADHDLVAAYILFGVASGVTMTFKPVKGAAGEN